MNSILKTVGVFAAGMLTFAVIVGKDVDKGDIIHDCADYYVKADKDKKCGWSYAKVVYKDPTKLV